MEGHSEHISLNDHNAFLGICGQSTKSRLSETAFRINGLFIKWPLVTKVLGLPLIVWCPGFFSIGFSFH
jgi:hypothetical protein